MYNFAELKTLSLATLSHHMRHRLNYSKKKFYTRSRRVLKNDRVQVISDFDRRISAFVDEGFDIVNVGESAFMVGELSGKAWSAIGHHKVVDEPTNNLQRVTLVLGVSLKGRVFRQLILGSSTAAIFSEFIISIEKTME